MYNNKTEKIAQPFISLDMFYERDIFMKYVTNFCTSRQKHFNLCEININLHTKNAIFFA